MIRINHKIKTIRVCGLVVALSIAFVCTSDSLECLSAQLHQSKASSRQMADGKPGLPPADMKQLSTVTDKAQVIEHLNKAFAHVTSQLEGIDDATLTGKRPFLGQQRSAANIALTTVKQMMDALHVGPILLGTNQPAHILTPSVTSRGIVNMTALSVVEASQKT